MLRRFTLVAFSIGLGLLAAGALLRFGPAQAVARAAPSTDIIVTTTIQAAIDAASAGDTVVVLAGLYTESLTLDKPVSLTGELSATTIVVAWPNERAITITGATLTPSIIISGLTFRDGNVTGDGGGLAVLGGAQPLLQNLIIQNNLASGSGGGLYAEAGALMVGVQFISNTASNGGAGWVTNGDVSLNAGRIELNTANDAGGLRVDNGQLWLTDTQVLSNTALTQGTGGVWASGNVTVSGGVFQNNHGVESGGGLYAGAALVLSDVQFMNNTANDGGGAYAGAAADATNVLFQNNQAAGTGGGLYLGLGGSLNSVQLVGNVAGGAGGGGWAATGNVHLNETRIELNQADSVGGFVADGGGIWMTNTLVLSNTALAQNSGGLWAMSALTTSGGRFENNLGAGSGGGFYAGATSALSGTQFISNTTSGAGGGGNIMGGGPSRLTDTVFISNTAQNGGGIWVSGGGVVAGGMFQSNTVPSSGGGLNVTGPLTVLAGARFINNRASVGGAVAQSAGSVLVTNALFARNKATGTGHALYLNANASITLRHTTVASPTLAAGSAIGVLGTGNMTISNTVLSHQGVGIQRLGVLSLNEDYNLFFGNNLNTLNGVSSGGHSLTADPAFVDIANDDYHLTPASAALDLGVNTGINIDFENDPRPQGGGFDIGWDEAPYTATPDLVVTKTVTPPFAVTGTPITYTIAFSNAGAVGYNVVITDLVPSELLSVTTFNTGAVLTPTGGLTYTWQAGTLLPGAGGFITVTGIVSAPVGIFTNTVNITAANGDLNPTDNLDSVSFNVTFPTTPPNLSDVGDKTGYVGIPLTFTVLLSDLETALVDLVLTGASSDQASVPDATIIVSAGNTDEERLVTITPAMAGMVTITLLVTDGDFATASDTFILMIEAEQPKLYLPLILH